MALATPEDVEAYLGRDLTPAEEAKVGALLDRASALVSAYTGKSFTLVEDDTIVLRADGSFIQLPETPVLEVTSIKPITMTGPGAEIVSFYFDGISSVDMRGYGVVINYPEMFYNYCFETFQVVYTHGYATVPVDIVGLVAAMVGNALSAGSVGSGAYGLTSETQGNYSYRLSESTSGGAFNVRLSDEDKEILKKYKGSNFGSIAVGSR